MEKQDNWREFTKGTSDRGGRERDIEDYEGYLGFKKESLEGKIVLDLGSGEQELLSQDLKNSGINAKVFHINPDYSLEKKFREKVLENPEWQKRSIGAVGQELPFKNETFDEIFALYSVTVFADPVYDNPEAAKKWMREITRVLKPGGEIRIAPISAENEQEIFEGKYGTWLTSLKKEQFSIQIEMIKNKDLGIKIITSTKFDGKGNKFTEAKDVSNYHMYQARIIIKKP